MIALDTETTGLDAWHGSRPFMTMIYKDDEILWWIWKVNPLTREVKIPEKHKQEIRSILKGEEVVLQNSKFDVRMLEMAGITNTDHEKWDWSLIKDTTISSHLLNSSLPAGLTSACLNYIGVDISQYEADLQRVCGAARRFAKQCFPDWKLAESGEDMPSVGSSKWKADMWLPGALADELGHPKDHEWRTVVRDYALADPEATYLLFREQERLMQEKGLIDLFNKRMEVLPIAYEMESNGVTVSDKMIDALEVEYKENSAKYGKRCTSIANRFDYELTLPKSGNNKSVTEFIFDKLQLPVVKTTKKGNASLDKSTFVHYLETLKPNSREHTFIKNLVDKRKLDTAVGYLAGYKKYKLPSGVEFYSVLHPYINPTGTATLRWSSKHPNEQNISKKEGVNLRRAFGPAPDREWWALDYNNLELRIPAYECQEPAMLELFEKPNEPPFYGSYHLLIFSILHPNEFRKYGKDVATVYKSTLYSWTKNGNFAELYGAVDTHDGNSTADRAFHYPGAQAIVAEKLKKKSGLNQYWIEYARQRGYVETMPDDRIDPDRGYPLHCRRKWGKISPTIPLNYHVQGTACWIMMMAMLDVQKYLDKLGPEYKMIMQVHDELVFDFPKKKNKGNLGKINKIQRIMENQGKHVGVKLTCGVDYHPNNWGTVE